MPRPVPPTDHGHVTRMKRGLILLTACAVIVAPLSFAALPAQAANEAFETSFEAGQALPPAQPVPIGSPVNISGQTIPGQSSMNGKIASVTASNNFNATETGPNAADYDPATKWLANYTSGVSLTYKLTAAITVDKYVITTANDEAGRDPKDWKLEGSNDGTAWTVVDTQAGKLTGAARLTDYTFAAATPGTYSQFRLTITANQGAGLMQIAGLDLQDSSLPAGNTSSPMVTRLTTGPISGYNIKTGMGYSGKASVRYGGSHVADGPASSTTLLVDNVNTTIETGDELSYVILPEQPGAYDPNYSSTYTAVDLEVKRPNGSVVRTSTLGLRDQYGFTASAQGQGTGKSLYQNQWNKIRVDLSSLAGSTVTRVFLEYNDPNARANIRFGGWVDDVAIKPAAPKVDGSSLVNYVDTRRGTNSSGGFSRGNNFPAATWPNGFNFLTPMTSNDSNTWLYSYAQSNNGDNLPTLQGLGISHEPSGWMGDRNQFSVMPTLDAGIPGGTPSGRATAFRHEDESARPDEYAVKLQNGIAARMAPTDHGGIMSFSFPSGKGGTVLVDAAGSGGKGVSFTVDDAGRLTGWVDNVYWSNAGQTRMFVVGQFSERPTAVGTASQRAQAKYAQFPAGSSPELRFATSFISVDQAQHNFDLELTGRSYDAIRGAAKDIWNERLGVIDLSRSNATDVQKTNLYSSLYRLNMYPNSQSENVGTAAAPKWQYASPVTATQGNPTDTRTNAVVKDGQMYVNNGFWDTYRSAWPLYAFLYPEVSQKLIDGMVQQYRDGGWIARWSSPGYANLMSGTSSDAAFAESYILGTMPTAEAEETYAAAVKNATVASSADKTLGGWAPAVGRERIETTQYVGWNPSVSWGLENAINDFAIAKMAKKLSTDAKVPADRKARYAEDAAYYLQRSFQFANQYDPKTGFMLGRNADGSFKSSPGSFNPLAWSGDNDFREASGWTYMFMASQDADGVAALLGGGEGIKKKLDEFYAAAETMQYSNIHEAAEARDVRLGQLAISNQPAQGIPYISAQTGDPTRTQAVIHEVMQRLFVGSEIGQGYPGDEDNGQTSAWYVFSALGFYPLAVGGDDYVIGTPLYDNVVVHRDARLGGDLTITAPGNGYDTPYLSGVKVGDTALPTAMLSKSALAKASSLSFSMSKTPTGWGTFSKSYAKPKAFVDVTADATVASPQSTNTASLTDNSSMTNTTFTTNTPVVTATMKLGAQEVSAYTITSSTTATSGATPTAWTLEGSNDGASWTMLDTRSGESFRYNAQLRNFAIKTPGTYSQYRLSITGSTSGALSLAELELLADPAAASSGDLKLAGSADVRAVAGTKTTLGVGVLTGRVDVAATTVSVDFMDGTGSTSATLTERPNGGYLLQADHAFATAGTYDALVTVRAEGKTLVAKTRILVSRHGGGADALAGSATVNCFAELGVGGSCDGQGWAYNVDKLADAGFAAGKSGSYTIGGETLKFQAPDIAPEAPDTVVPKGQTVPLLLAPGTRKLGFIGLANEGDQQTTITLTYADGQTQSVPVSFGDWVGKADAPIAGNVVVARTDRRLSGGTDEGKPAALYGTAPVTLRTGADGAPLQVVSMTLANEPKSLQAGLVHIAAIATDTDPVVGTLAVTAGKDVSAHAKRPLQAVLASFSKVSPVSTEVRASVNWGDGTPTDVTSGAPKALARALAASGSSVKIDGANVSGTHVYAAPGDYTATVTVDDGITSQTVTIPVTVVSTPTPTITAADRVYRPGGAIAVGGAGFTPGDTVTVGEAPLGPVTAVVGEDGKFSATVPIPRDIATGSYSIGVQAPSDPDVAPVTVRVERPVSTTTTLSAASTRVDSGAAIRLTVNIAGTRTGSVSIMEDGKKVADVRIVDAAGTAQIPTKATGKREFTAVLSGTDAYTGSTSGTVTVTVVASGGTKPDPGTTPTPIPSGNGNGGGDGDLPSTGQGVPTMAFGGAVALLLAGGGIAFLRALRRRRVGNDVQ